MARLCVTLVLLALFLAAHVIKAQSTPKAVSIDHIKSLGIITNGWQACDSTSPIDVFSDPDSTAIVGSIANHSFVRYDRHSELVGKPYNAARVEYALPGGEKFWIHHNGVEGWIGINNMMTFSSVWRQRRINEFFALGGGAAVCLYSSGQHETCMCAALTIWQQGAYDRLWRLNAVEYDPVPLGLYACPAIDTLVAYGKGGIAILVSARSGDAEDAWGSYVFYLYQGDSLVSALAKDYSYSGDRDYTKLHCELSLDEAGAPVALMINRHFIVNPSVPGYASTLTATDTTVINLLEHVDER